MAHMAERMGPGILSGPLDEYRRHGGPPPKVEGVVGMVATHLGSRFTGTIVGFDAGGVVLRSPGTGIRRRFPLRSGDFVVRGAAVTLVPGLVAPVKPAVLSRTASGSIAARGHRARVARPSRLLVEGIHDAELVEKIWGDDLRVDGVVVERLDGIDHLADVLRAYRPAADARLGVLVDHLVPGSKESRLAAELAGPHVRILGTPFVDIWQAVRPSVLGIGSWPVVPPGRPWKDGICEAFGEPSPGQLWKRLLGRARSYADLEPALVGAVEALIDFVTGPEE
jgi:Protein of unknown function (DUF3097)